MNYEKSIAFLARTEEERLLLAHTQDLLSRAGGGIAAADFLNLGEQYLVRAFLGQCGLSEGTDYVFFGGYPYAERRMLVLFPEYLSATFAYAQPAEETTDEDAAVTSAAAAVCAEEQLITAIAVSGSGYKTLTHRDYLGSLLALGIERTVIGDIAVTDDSHAVIFTKSAMADFVCTALERIGADKVRCARLSADEAGKVPDTRRWETFSDTVASLRLDGIVAAAANLSRDRAKQLVSSGFVEVDFRLCDAPDTELSPGMYLSIRGYGRYLFDALDGTSKKGRLRIRLKKLI